MKALDSEKNDVYKFLGCEQSDDIDVRKVLERVNKEIKKRYRTPGQATPE